MMMHGLLFSKSIEKGQTLLEVLIALGVGVFVIVAAATLTSNSISNTQSSKDQNLATQFAQEGIEIARKDRLPAPTGSDAVYCLVKDATVLPSPTANGCSSTANINGVYMREVTLSLINASGSCGASTYQVASRVYWTDNKCTAKFCRNVELITCLAP